MSSTQPTGDGINWGCENHCGNGLYRTDPSIQIMKWLVDALVNSQKFMTYVVSKKKDWGWMWTNLQVQGSDTKKINRYQHFTVLYKTQRKKVCPFTQRVKTNQVPFEVDFKSCQLGSSLTLQRSQKQRAKGMKKFPLLYHDLLGEFYRLLSNWKYLFCNL